MTWGKTCPAGIDPAKWEETCGSLLAPLSNACSYGHTPIVALTHCEPAEPGFLRDAHKSHYKSRTDWPRTLGLNQQRMGDLEMPGYHRLSKAKALRKWGDYGDVLCNGIDLRKTEETPLRLGRTGPFVPPISLVWPGHVVVTDETMEKIEEARLNGVGDFRPVVIEKAVKSDWHMWDRDRKIDDNHYPLNNEPEEYILHPPHDPATAAAMGPLWTWHPAHTGEAVGPPETRRIEQVSATADVFRVHRLLSRGVFVSERGRAVLAELFGDWLSFEDPLLPIFTR